jgi:hypothetical protein
LVVVGLVVGAALGFVLGVILTAPIVGWPHAFPGLLMDAPESVRELVVKVLLCGCPIATSAALWLLGLRRAWRG